MNVPVAEGYIKGNARSILRNMSAENVKGNWLLYNRKKLKKWPS